MKQKLTKFQQTFKRQHAIEIVKVFHPDLTDEQIEKHIKFGPGSYCWNQIEFNVRDYGRVSIGVSNYTCHTLWGPTVSKNDIQEAINNGDIYFRCWRFCMDKFEKQESYGSPERKALEEKSETILKKHYQVQSVNEFYTQYYDD